MRDELKIQLDGPTGAVASFGPVVYLIWRAHDSLDPINAADVVMERLIERYGPGRKIFYVQRAPETDGRAAYRSDPQVRDAALKHFERHDASVAAAAVAIEAVGFRGSVIRSITAGVLLVRRTAIKTEAFKDARDGVRWLAGLARDVNPFDGEAMIKSLEANRLALSDQPLAAAGKR
ncbi:MAG: hypothetical protein Q8O67_03515 [Deltaproteobacteria bacterium]|nr:hypothetical protein [Deltaproteobacteria bacterium]